MSALLTRRRWLSNRPLKWTGHHPFLAAPPQAPCLPLRAAFDRSNMRLQCMVRTTILDCPKAHHSLADHFANHTFALWFTVGTPASIDCNPFVGVIPKQLIIFGPTGSLAVFMSRGSVARKVYALRICIPSHPNFFANLMQRRMAGSLIDSSLHDGFSSTNPTISQLTPIITNVERMIDQGACISL